MLDMSRLHAKWLRPDVMSNTNFTKFHPHFLALQNELRGLRERVTDSIESTARFTLPFPVETYIRTINPVLHSESKSSILYVTLRA